LMEHMLEVGGDDFTMEEGTVIITCAPETATAVGEAMTKHGYTVLSAEAEMLPSTYTKLTDDEHIKKMTTLLEMLEDNDDVQNVWHNWE
ncbi:MAG: YebC/PmpR family DNA-binding transcriptional regulator, partial [Oscillospiraceae bacterium]|nr:YebC/PmpR family DNA-binding transcriptional regulator [Oscillospiraceae bacterium]